MDGSAKSGFQPGMGMIHRKINAGNAQSKRHGQSERAGLVGVSSPADCSVLSIILPSKLF